MTLSPRSLSWLAFLLLGGGTFLSPASSATPSSPSPPPSLLKVSKKVNAKAALLIDATTGKVLFARRIHDRHPPASTLKLMTILVAWEQLGGPQGNLIVKKEDRAEPSNVPLIPGEVVKVKDMMPAVLLGSDNDAARALARFAGGDNYSHFIHLMNKKALDLGCRRTVFKNPNGLPIEGQYTTCEDLMKIFKAAISIPKIREWARTKSFLLKTKASTQWVKNHNKLLGSYPGMDAAKTGWTYTSRHTYAASVTRDGHELHLTLLNSPNKWKDARALFDYGFAALTSEANPYAPSLAFAETSQEKKIPHHSRLELRPYIIQKGDTLFGLCKAFSIRLEDLLQVNTLQDPSRIYPGQKIMIPLLKK